MGSGNSAYENYILAQYRSAPEGVREVPSPSILVDAHVHFHACFGRREFLDSAARNFAAASERLALSAATSGVLMFSECSKDRYFRTFRESAGEEWPGRWVLHRTAEATSLVARREGGPDLFLVAGRQIISAERLELLALGCDADLPDGQALESSIEAVEQSSGLAVLPWGLGKWTFGRGRRVAEIVGRRTAGGLFLGDNGGRPALLPRPALFGEAERRGIRVLPGTDPLPLAAEVGRVGSYGSVMRTHFDPAYPARSLLAFVRDSAFRPEPYGSLRPIGPFLWSQIALRLRRAAG